MSISELCLEICSPRVRQSEREREFVTWDQYQMLLSFFQWFVCIKKYIYYFLKKTAMPEWKTETRRQNIPFPFSLTFQIMRQVGSGLTTEQKLSWSQCCNSYYKKKNKKKTAATTKTKTNTEQSEDVVIYIADLQNWKGIMVGIM